MPTPPRIIEQVPASRVGELDELAMRLDQAIDYVQLAELHARKGQPLLAGAKLEVARGQVAKILEELNTFRAPAPAPRKKYLSLAPETPE